MNDVVRADISSAASGMQVEETSNGHTRDEDIKSSSTEAELIIDATSIPDDIKSKTDQLLKNMVFKDYYDDDDDDDDAKNADNICNSKSVVTVDVWDFAGQHLYYAAHPVFLSSRAVYILVHNLSKPLNDPALPTVRQGAHDVSLENPNNETNLENLLAWLVTVHSIKATGEGTVDNSHKMLPYLRPPVFIVGTHADTPFEDTKAVKSKIQREIAGKEYEKHVIRPFFDIDNTQGKRVLVDNTQGKKSMLQLIKQHIFGKDPRRSHQAGNLVWTKCL